MVQSQRLTPNLGGCFSSGTEDRTHKVSVCRSVAVIPKLGFDRDLCTRATNLRSHRGSPLRNMQRPRFGQPSVAIDAGTLVIPAFIQRRVNTHLNQVRATVLHEVRDIEAERRVATEVSFQEGSRSIQQSNRGRRRQIQD